MNSRSTKNRIEMLSVPGLEGVRSQTRNFSDSWTSPRHVHHEYVFSLMIEGSTAVDCGHCGETHLVQPGDLLLTEAHEVYAGRALGKPPWRNFSLSVSNEKLVSLLDPASDGKRGALPHFAQGAINNDRLRRLFLKLLDSLTKERATLERETLLLDWVVSVVQDYGAEAHHLQNRRIYSESAAVRRAREYLRENLSENVKLQTLAEIAGLSPFHLNRAFSAQIGVPPHEYQNQLRIAEALDLIARKKPFSEIALTTGFSDQSHFIRFFKRFTGVTPKRFFAR